MAPFESVVGEQRPPDSFERNSGRNRSSPQDEIHGGHVFQEQCLKTSVAPKCLVHHLLEDNILPRECYLAPGFDNNNLFHKDPPSDRCEVFGNSGAACWISGMIFLKPRVNGRIAVIHALGFNALFDLGLITDVSG